MSALLTVKIHYITNFDQIRDTIQKLMFQEQKDTQNLAFWSVKQEDCTITLFFTFNSMEEAQDKDIHMIEFSTKISEMWEKIEMEYHKVIIDETYQRQGPSITEFQKVPLF